MEASKYFNMKRMQLQQTLFSKSEISTWHASVTPISIPENHLCRMVKEVVFFLDTSQIESCYSPEGQRSYHPRLMLSILFYGYATGVRSSRILASKCISDDYYKFLTQFYRPDYRIISDFRKDNIDAINSYFVAILREYLRN